MISPQRQQEILKQFIARIQIAQLTPNDFHKCIMDIASDASLVLQNDGSEKLRTDNAFKRLIVCPIPNSPTS